MAVADRQVWVLGEPQISDDQLWVLGEPFGALDADVTPHRFTQDVVEVPHQVTGADLLRRFTQAPVEVPHQVTGADLIRRFTQIVIEVAITFPVHPWADQPFPEHPAWSPAYIQDPIESKEQVYASFYGSHNKEIVIGERGGRTKFTRR